MFKLCLPGFFTTLIVTLVITITCYQAEAKEKAQHIASDFTLKNLGGREVSLRQFRGKYLLVNFWATWCGPCKIEMPSLENLYQRFKSYNFDMLGISNDMFGDRVVRPYVTAKNITFPMLLDQ